jgi:hypothetical protein
MVKLEGQFDIPQVIPGAGREEFQRVGEVLSLHWIQRPGSLVEELLRSDAADDSSHNPGLHTILFQDRGRDYPQPINGCQEKSPESYSHVSQTVHTVIHGSGGRRSKH